MTMKFCRACSVSISDNCALDTENNILNLNLCELLKECVPEVTHSLADSYFCLKCFSFLYLYRDFRNTCLKTEQRISDFIRRQQPMKTASLTEVFCETVRVKEEAIEENECGTRTETEFVFVSDVKAESSERYEPIEECKVVAEEDPIDGSKVTEPTALWKCDICYDTFPSDDLLRLHCQQHREVHRSKVAERHECPQCEYVGHKKLYLERHWQRKHANVNKRNFCEYCGYSTQYMTVLKRHVQLKHSEESYRCYYCRMTVPDKKALRDHLVLEHEMCIDDSA